MEDNKQNSETKNTPASGTQINYGQTTTGGQTNTGAASAAKSPGEKSNTESGDSVKETFNKAKDAAGQAATEVVGQAKEKASSLIGEQKSHLAAGIGTVADSIRQIGENLQHETADGEKNQVAAFAGKYGDSLAERVERISHYMEGKDLGELASDAEQFARRNPTLFVGGAFALGILAARFLKSSDSRRTGGNKQLSKSVGKTGSKNTAVQAS